MHKVMSAVVLLMVASLWFTATGAEEQSRDNESQIARHNEQLEAIDQLLLSLLQQRQAGLAKRAASKAKHSSSKQGGAEYTVFRYG